MSATVRDVMTTRVLAVREHTSVKEMVARMKEHRVSAFPVIDDDNLVLGVVSEADLLTKEVAFAGDQHGLAALPTVLRPGQRARVRGASAGELMTHPAVTVRPDTPVTQAARLLYEHKVKRLPVVDDGGHLVGIVSRVDVLSVYGRSDDDIRRDVATAIATAVPADPTSFTMTVKDGVVSVAGRAESVMVARQVLYAARHVPGVVTVRDRLDYPSPAIAPLGGPVV